MITVRPLLATVACLTTTAGATQDVAFLAASTTVRSGHTAVIPYACATTRDTQTPSYELSNAACLRVIRPPEALADQPYGFLRVEGLQPGSTDLRIGQATLTVNVVESTPLSRDIAPHIVSPATGAAVWGQFTVAVVARQNPRHEHDQISLRLPDGTIITSTDEIATDGASHRLLSFTVDATDWPAQPAELVPVRGSGAVAGPPVRVRVVQPAQILAGEAEARYEVERPERFRQGGARIGRDKDASGGAYLVNNSPQPALCYPVRVDQPGLYQVAITASGSMACGALPSIDLFIDGAQYRSTNGRLAAEGWHRAIIGIPVRLEAGTRIVTPYFANDFYVRGSDRNLRIDRIEVARIEQESQTNTPRDLTADAGSGDSMMMMSMMGGASPVANLVQLPPDPLGREDRPLRVAMTKPIDGLSLTGQLNLKAICWADGINPRNPRSVPDVELEINGAVIATQKSLSPNFVIDPAYFSPGPNQIRLRARLASGALDETPTQTVHWDGAELTREPLAMHRFTLHEDRWDPAKRSSIRNELNPAERGAFVLTGSDSITLELPPELQGPFDIYVEGRTAPNGTTDAALTIQSPTGTSDVGDVTIRHWWETRPVASAELPAGPKTLVLTLDGADKNLHLQSISLQAKRTWTDDESPVVDVIYPSDNQAVARADTIIFSGRDNVAIDRAELLIDDQPTGITLHPRGHIGLFSMPVPLRTLQPGPHEVRILATDGSGNRTTTEAIAINVLPADAPTSAYERAVTLCDRLAYGPEPQELAVILTAGEQAWLEQRLTDDASSAGELAALGTGLVRWPLSRGIGGVSRRAVDHTLRTPNPVRTRFVLWAENHFSTWGRKTEGDRKWLEHVAFFEHGAAPFIDLLTCSAKSPAMLHYLDQRLSFAGRINENYAREIMELYTLGVDGGYSQDDVTRLATLLTGWSAVIEGDGRSGGNTRSHAFRFDPHLSDGSDTTVIGLNLPTAEPHERLDRIHLVLETLASHPSTARYIARKLAEHYVSCPAPESLIDDLATTFHESGGDTAAMLLTLAQHPDFWEAPNRLAHPLQYALRLTRPALVDNPWRVTDYLQRGGTGMFDRATPDGYPEEDAEYANSNAMIQRWSLAQDISWAITNHVPHAWRGEREPDDEWAQRIVDILAIRMTGRTLSPESNDAALQVIASADGSAMDRIRTLAPFMAQLPEANLR